MENLARMIDEKKVAHIGITDLRDESDRDGTRVVIEVSVTATTEALGENNAVEEVVAQLFRHSLLQSVFAGNMLCLVDDGSRPKKMSLREMLTSFISFRFACFSNSDIVEFLHRSEIKNCKN